MGGAGSPHVRRYRIQCSLVGCRGTGFGADGETRMLMVDGVGDEETKGEGKVCGLVRHKRPFTPSHRCRLTCGCTMAQGEEAGAQAAALQRPQFDLAKAISMRAAKWGTAPGLAVRFTLLCNGEPTECVPWPHAHPCGSPSNLTVRPYVAQPQRVHDRSGHILCGVP